MSCSESAEPERGALGGLWQCDDGRDLKCWRLGWHQDGFLELSSLVWTKEDWSHAISLALGTSVSLEKR